MKKYYKSLGISLAVLMVMLGVGAVTVLANPGYFYPSASSSTASTTVSTLIAGTATTTVVYDSYGINGTNEPTGYKPDSTDSATLLVQLTASSTATQLMWRYEYSQDGVDWYADNMYSLPITGSSSPIVLNNATTYSWQFASSSSQCDTTVINSTNNRGCKAINVPTPSRYVRVVFTLPTGSANAEVYASFLPKKQNN